MAPAAADLDVLVTVAGIGSTTHAPATPLEVWEEVFAVNARGTFLCCKHAIPGMAARGGGSIVNVASVAALVGLRNRAAYCASKGAVVALTRALAVDHVGEGIRVNAVCPGTVDTPIVAEVFEKLTDDLDTRVADRLMMMLPGGAIKPAEIGETIVWLASPSARMITGAVIAHDGGMS